jgi:hypothetical protein
MEKLMIKIVSAVINGKDYRPFVLATINKRFLDNAYALLKKIFYAKKNSKGKSDWWVKDLLKSSSTKIEVLWFGGLNNKTVTNMMGTTKKEVCIDLGEENLKSIKILTDELKNTDIPSIEIKIKYKSESVVLSEWESLVLLNTIAAMKLTIQGGAWSEVGKKSEKRLLFTLFELLQIPQTQYILIFDEMRKRGLVENREIDAIVYSDDKKKVLQIELKLLGIGNPEIGDEALARKVDLFLIDRLTPMMIEEAKKIGVKVIEFRGRNSLKEICEFFNQRGISAKLPKLDKIETLIKNINQKYDEDLESKKILLKAKEIARGKDLFS